MGEKCYSLYMGGKQCSSFRLCSRSFRSLHRSRRFHSFHKLLNSMRYRILQKSSHRYIHSCYRRLHIVENKKHMRRWCSMRSLYYRLLSRSSLQYSRILLQSTNILRYIRIQIQHMNSLQLHSWLHKSSHRYMMHCCSRRSFRNKFRLHMGYTQHKHRLRRWSSYRKYWLNDRKLLPTSCLSQ